MTLVIIHPEGCTCGRHADCPHCLDSGYTSMSWDSKGFHGTICRCASGTAIRDHEARIALAS